MATNNNETEFLQLFNKLAQSVSPTAIENVAMSDSFEDLNLDSVATLELVAEMESHLNTVFADEQLSRIQSVGDLYNLTKETT